MADLDPENLASLKVTELKAELKKRGLPGTGLKQALVDRLREHILEQQQGAEDTKSPTPAPEPEDDEPAADAPVTEQEATPAKEPTPEPAAETQPAPEVQAEAPAEPKEDAPAQPVDEAAEEPTPMDVDAPSAEVEATKEVDLEREPAQSPAQEEPQQQQQQQHEEQSPAKDPEPAPEPAPEAPRADAADDGAASQPAASAPSVDEDTPMTDAPAADAAPPTATTDIEVDPIDTLKRKRRSPSPPPSPTAVAEVAAVVKVTSEPPPADEDPAPTPKKARTSVSPPRRTARRDSRDARFKDLVKDDLQEHAPAAGDDDDEEPVPPSIHPATRALYIRNFVRPLHEGPLKAHITHLASRGEQELDHEPIEMFFLDSIKSHALLVFSSLTEATRVRVGMHGKVFPNERNRKSLWADFVPEEKVAAWIEKEKERTRGTGRWEVYYDTSGEEVVCELVEAGTGMPAAPAARKPSVDISGAPSGPRRPTEAVPRKRVVMDLDQLFRSTRTKPKLYFLPVDPARAEERLKKEGRDPSGRR